MHARPATAPVKAPMRLGLPSNFQVMNSQVHMAMEPEMSVFTKAWAAMPPAVNESPPLKPNQPNHSSAVPSPTKAMLCGMLRSPLPNTRRPTTQTEARAAMPALVCTTAPPAKSSAPHCARKPPPHTQWQNGM